jgi:hypothetical protein
LKYNTIQENLQSIEVKRVFLCKSINYPYGKITNLHRQSQTVFSLLNQIYLNIEALRNNQFLKFSFLTTDHVINYVNVLGSMGMPLMVVSA